MTPVLNRVFLATLAIVAFGCSSRSLPVANEAESEQSQLRASFRFDDCEFMTRMARALTDAGIAHRVEKDGSISHRSDQGAAVQRIGNEVMQARLQTGRKLSNECVEER
jgi:hypothetical protein